MKWRPVVQPREGTAAIGWDAPRNSEARLRYLARLPHEAITDEGNYELREGIDHLLCALEEIAEVPGRSVTSIIARRALDGLR